MVGARVLAALAAFVGKGLLAHSLLAAPAGDLPTGDGPPAAPDRPLSAPADLRDDPREGLLARAGLPLFLSRPGFLSEPEHPEAPEADATGDRPTPEDEAPSLVEARPQIEAGPEVEAGPTTRPTATTPAAADGAARQGGQDRKDGKNPRAAKDAKDGKDPKGQSILEDLGNTTFGKLFAGKKQLSPGEAVTLQFWLGATKDLVFAAVGFLPRLFVALMFLVLFWVIYRAIRRVVLGSMAKAHVDSSIRDLLGAVIKWGVMGFGLVIACNQVGIQITALLTGVSIIGLAIGFAAQETLANFIAGVVIFWDKPFKVGDWLDVDGKYGRVLRVSFRSTRLLNLDGEVIILPNTSVLAQKVTNHSTNSVNRVNVRIGIAYEASIDDARAALLATTRGDGRICRDPAPSVAVESCAESSVNLVLRFWIKDEAVEKLIQEEYVERAKRALDAAGVAIPYPHMQLLLEQTPALQALAAAHAAPAAHATPHAAGHPAGHPAHAEQAHWRKAG